MRLSYEFQLFVMVTKDEKLLARVNHYKNGISEAVRFFLYLSHL
jgi:hypothetical protein